MTLDTRDLVKRIGALKQRSTRLLDFAMEKALTEPIYLTEADLVDEDFDIPEAWQLKLTPSSEADLGYTQSLISPEGAELAFEDVFVSPEGLWMTRPQMEAELPAPAPIPEPVFATPDEELLYREYLRTGGTFDVETWTMIGGPIRPAETDIETLLDEILKMGRTPEAEALLRRIAPEATEADIQGFFSPAGIVVTDEAKNLFREVFPAGLNVDAFMDLGMEKPEELMKLIWMRGDTEASRNLMRSLWPQATEEGIDAFFTQETRVFMPEPERDSLGELLTKALPKVVTPNILDKMFEYFSDKPEVLRSNLITVGRNEETEALVRALYPGITDMGVKDYFSSQARRVEREALRVTEEGDYATFTAGVGGLISNFGGMFKWLGADGIGENLTRAGQFMQVRALPVEPVPFSWEQLFDVNSYYVQGFIQALPSLMLLAIPAIGAYSLAGSVALKIGVGATGRAIIAGVGGAALSRPIESAMEAGGAYDAARAKGLSHEEAKEVSNQVFLNNLKLAGLDAVQIAAMFLPPSARVINNVIARGLVRTVTVGGKLLFTGLTEGGEEVYQDILLRQALDEDIVWDEEMQLVFGIGTFAGIGMGAGGDIIVRIQNRVVGDFSAEQKAEFDKTKGDYRSQGFWDELATKKALDDMAEADETIAKSIEDAAKQVEKEITLDKITVKDEVDQAVVDNLKQKLAEEGKISPEAVVAPVSPAVEEFLATPDEQILRPSNEVINALEARGFSRDYITTKMSIPEMKQALRQPIPEAVPAVAKPLSELRLSGLEVLEEEKLIRGIKQKSIEAYSNVRKESTTVEYTELADKVIIESISSVQGKPETLRAILKTIIERNPNKQIVTTSQTASGRRYIKRLESEGLISIQKLSKSEIAAIPKLTGGVQVIEPVGIVITPLAVTKPPVVHRGTEPEGIAIGDEVGVRYDGIQEGFGDTPSTMMFTDVRQTESTFTAHTPEEARTKLANMREEFTEVEVAKPPVEITEQIETLKTKPLKAVPEPKEAAITPTGEKALTPVQVEQTLKLFGLYVESPNAINAWELTRELRRETLSGRAANLKDRTESLIVEEGLSSEEAMRQAIGETLKGELPVARTDYLSDLTEQMKAVLYNKLYEELASEPLEMASTLTALTNALAGRAIPREPGIKGGSAYTRLQRVFGTEVVKAIDKASSEGQSLQNVIEGLYEVTGLAPIPVDQATADYLRNLSTAPLGQAYLSGDTASLLELTEGKSAEQIAKETTDLKIDLAAEPVPPSPPHEPPIEDALNQMPLFPRPASDMVVKVLKELAWLPVDIGNFFRANLASFDFSFWRQQAPLIAAHPVSFVQANIEAWNATWSQKSAEASMQRITRDPLYQIYELSEEAGGDFLRPLELKKGTAQWKGLEEFGFPTLERVMPRLMAKIPWVKLSSRGFVIGTNVHNWLIFLLHHKGMLKVSEQYASGQKTLKVGEVFDAQKEMVDFGKSLANFTARGSLGKFSATAPILSSMFFAPRASIGRLLSVKDLINANPRVRKEAWKNATLFVSVVGGIILLGGAMGWWEVEKDPRRADYMSVKIGTTRVDPWGGYRQFFVFFTRMITSSGISSVTGAEWKADPIRTITNLVRSKASPLASIILDFWTGKNFIGEEVDVANPKQWAERIAPFAVQDIYEAWLEDPIVALGIAIPAIVGAGVQTYTGEWVENFAKLGLPKYSENLAYGMTEPYYDTQDFYSDHSGQFTGVDPETLTPEKGFPNYIKALVEAKVIKKELSALPNEKLISLNADPAKGATFADYYQMWRDREEVVASGDEEARIEFDKKFPQSELGNFSQRQFALLNEYWAITDEEEQDEFLEEHESEIGINLRQEYLRTHPKENAQLAVWGQAKIYSLEANTEVQRLIRELDIPDNAIPESNMPPEELAEDYFAYNEIVSESGASSAEAKLFRLEHGDLTNWGMANLGWDSNIGLRGIEYYRLQIKSKDAQAEYDALEVTEDRQRYLEDNPEFRDDRRRMAAMEYEIPENEIEDYVQYYTIDRAGYEDDWFLMEHLDFYNTMVDFEIWKPKDFSKVPTREVFALFEEWEALRDETGKALGSERRAFEAAHPELDQWLHLTKGTKLESERNGVTTTVTEETEEEPKQEPPKEEVDPALDNRRYWLDQASHYKDVLKNLGIREDITAEELTDAQADEIETAIVALRGW